jgi:hypothetical protein
LIAPFVKAKSHGLAGAAATALECRMNNFVKETNQYQQALA